MTRQREAVERPFKSYPYVWVVSKWGYLREVFRSRRDALEYCRHEASQNGYTRETWQELYEIRKATLTELC